MNLSAIARKLGLEDLTEYHEDPAQHSTYPQYLKQMRGEGGAASFKEFI